MPEQPEPSPEEMLHDAGCSKKVIAHARAVRDVACAFARGNPDVIVFAVEEGAMLHDIGRGFTHGLRHAQRGADYLRAAGYDEKIARIVECHTGAGLTADECSLLGLSPRDCIPVTTEEKIVTHADNLVAGVKRVSIHSTLGNAFHLPKKVRVRMYRLAGDVELLCGRH